MTNLIKMRLESYVIIAVSNSIPVICSQIYVKSALRRDENDRKKSGYAYYCNMMRKCIQTALSILVASMLIFTTSGYHLTMHHCNMSRTSALLLRLSTSGKIMSCCSDNVTFNKGGRDSGPSVSKQPCCETTSLVPQVSSTYAPVHFRLPVITREVSSIALIMSVIPPEPLGRELMAIDTGPPVKQHSCAIITFNCQLLC